MKTWKIVIRLDGVETSEISIEARDWESLVDYVFGNIEVEEVNRELEDNDDVPKPLV